MLKYIFMRLLAMIPIVLAVIFIIFLILYVTPGDVAAIILGAEFTPEAAHALREDLGLNRHFIVQYLDYIWGLARGDLGTSFITRAPVMDQIANRFPPTLVLVIVSMIFCTVISIPIGIMSAVKPNSIASNFWSAFSMIGLAMPNFWLALMFILLFAVNLGWLPASGSLTPTGIILPAVTMGISFMAGTMRMTRSAMLESLHQDYIRTARAKGVSRRDVINKHAMRNAWLPVVTIIGLNMGMLLGGAVVIENVFAFPGMGRLLVVGVTTRDTPTVLACLVVMAVCIAVCNLIVDVVYAYIDPRVKSMYSVGRKKHE